ncbi:10881_t:CDS:2 [Entrophospora sp. SA101]|nr:3673_t:CDS:2 [Entrophospora sp. SA101]CAJ0747725.1 10881_t:CDS:2 [Entrophospora sp. SA101]CAJ0835815.1 954_t:CDS:2 [Entrophospora sp. SA101]CAJ0842064.1 592_t:CDS:2 [Entrophospora sp. SA101]
MEDKNCQQSTLLSNTSQKTITSFIKKSTKTSNTIPPSETKLSDLLKKTIYDFGELYNSFEINEKLLNDDDEQVNIFIKNYQLQIQEEENKLISLMSVVSAISASSSTPALTSNNEVVKEMPNYQRMTIPELKLEVAKYGIRPSSKEIMIRQLVHIWSKLNVITASNGSSSPSME